MKIDKIVYKGTEHILNNQPSGVDDIAIEYERDTDTSGMLMSISAKLKFYCGSGKEIIDEAYNDSYIDAEVFVYLSDICGSDTIEIKGLVDFSTYKRDSNFSEVGLLDDNPTTRVKKDWKKKHKIDYQVQSYVNIPPLNIPNQYLATFTTAIYQRDSSVVIIRMDSKTHIYNWEEDTFTIYPKTQIEINELDKGNDLTAEYYETNVTLASKITATGDIITSTSTTVGAIQYSPIEPQPIFTNESGNIIGLIQQTDHINPLRIKIETNGTILDINTIWLNVQGNYIIKSAVLYEYVIVGSKYNAPKFIKRVRVHEFSRSEMFYISPQELILETSNAEINYQARNYYLNPNDNIWVYYELEFINNIALQSVYNQNTQQWEIVEPPNRIQRNFITGSYSTLTMNRRILLTTFSYLNETRINKFVSMHRVVFNLFPEIGNDNLFKNPAIGAREHLLIINGERLRDKVNKNDWLVTQEQIFQQVDAILGIGIGTYYLPDGTAKITMQRLAYFYSNEVYKTYTVNTIDDITISVEDSIYYNEINVGYTKTYLQQRMPFYNNKYTIDNRAKKSFTRITEWIATPYLLLKGKYIGTEDKPKEYDKDIFVLNVVNAEAANPTPLINDDINTTITPKINRRYFSVFNLYRHFIRWGGSLYKQYSTLRSELTQNTTSQYPANTEQLPTSSLPIMATINNGQQSPIIPEVIEFSALETIATFYEMRKHWYKCIEVTDGITTYKGNIISARHENGVTKFKLIRRV